MRFGMRGNPGSLRSRYITTKDVDIVRGYAVFLPYGLLAARASITKCLK